jgi:hypothetical protein
MREAIPIVGIVVSAFLIELGEQITGWAAAFTYVLVGVVAACLLLVGVPFALGFRFALAPLGEEASAAITRPAAGLILQPQPSHLARYDAFLPLNARMYWSSTAHEPDDWWEAIQERTARTGRWEVDRATSLSTFGTSKQLVVEPVHPQKAASIMETKPSRLIRALNEFPPRFPGVFPTRT